MQTKWHEIWENRNADERELTFESGGGGGF